MISLLLSCLAVIGTVAIPLLLGAVVDAVGQAGPRRPPATGPRADHSARASPACARGAPPPDLGSRVAGRRVRRAKPALPPPAGAGARLLRPPADRQLMSRVTVDLQSVRFFLGYGLIFILQNLLDDPAGGDRDVRAPASMAAITLAPVPLVVLAAARYGRRSPAGPSGGPAADRGADRRGGGEHLGHPCREGVCARGRTPGTGSGTGSVACSTRACSPPGCAPSTTR